MLANDHLIEKVILEEYAKGVLSRSSAMQELGLTWYGDLLQKMIDLGVKLISPSKDDLNNMEKVVIDVFSSTEKDRH